MGKFETNLKSIRLRQDVIEKVQKMAEDNNRSFTNMVETILMDKTKEIRI